MYDVDPIRWLTSWYCVWLYDSKSSSCLVPNHPMLDCCRFHLTYCTLSAGTYSAAADADDEGVMLMEEKSLEEVLEVCCLLCCTALHAKRPTADALPGCITVA